MSDIGERLRSARESGDLEALSTLIPFNAWLGIGFTVVEGSLVARMAFREHQVGNPAMPALHGGTLASLLESTAVFLALMGFDNDAVPKTINITVDYLRPAGLTDTYATGRVLKAGRRVVTVELEAWQDRRERLVASGRAHLLLTRAP